MGSIILISSILLVGSVFFLFGFHYVKGKYKEFDHRETVKENILKLKADVKDAMDYFRETYNTDFDHTIYETLRIKVNFITNILNKIEDYDRKLYYYDKLYKRLYETGYRLKTNFNDVGSIISPLKNLIEELVNEKLNDLRGLYES